jgi:hypothetical protein
MDVEATASTASAGDKFKSRSNTSLADRSIAHGENDLLGGERVDQVLAAKMNLINDVSSRGTTQWLWKG